MLSTVEADSPLEYVHSGSGTGVVDSAPLWPTNITVGSSWYREQDQTIEFWFKQEPNSTNTYAVLSFGINASNRVIVSVGRSNHPSVAGKVGLSVYGSFKANYYSANRYDDGQWHHCVIIMLNGGNTFNQYFYFDGQYESYNNRVVPLDIGSWGNTYIGDCSKFAAGYVIGGSPIDEIALYDYELLDPRIQAHYDEVMFGPVVPPLPEIVLASTVVVSGKLKTNKRIRLASHIDVGGFIRALVLNDPLPFSIASQVNIEGSMAALLNAKTVRIATTLQPSEIEATMRKGIDIRL